MLKMISESNSSIFLLLLHSPGMLLRKVILSNQSHIFEIRSEWVMLNKDDKAPYYCCISTLLFPEIMLPSPLIVLTDTGSDCRATGR